MACCPSRRQKRYWSSPMLFRSLRGASADDEPGFIWNAKVVGNAGKSNSSDTGDIAEEADHEPSCVCRLFAADAAIWLITVRVSLVPPAASANHNRVARVSIVRTPIATVVAKVCGTESGVGVGHGLALTFQPQAFSCVGVCERPARALPSCCCAVRNPRLMPITIHRRRQSARKRRPAGCWGVALLLCRAAAAHEVSCARSCIKISISPASVHGIKSATRSQVSVCPVAHFARSMVRTIRASNGSMSSLPLSAGDSRARNGYLFW